MARRRRSPDVPTVQHRAQLFARLAPLGLVAGFIVHVACGPEEPAVPGCPTNTAVVEPQSVVAPGVSVTTATGSEVATTATGVVGAVTPTNGGQGGSTVVSLPCNPQVGAPALAVGGTTTAVTSVTLATTGTI